MKRKGIVTLIILTVLILVFFGVGLISYEVNYIPTSESSKLENGECCECKDLPNSDVCCSCKTKNFFMKVVEGWQMFFQ